MARFKVNGLDTLTADIEKIARLSDEDKIAILEAGAPVLIRAMQDELRRQGLMDKRAPQLINSFEAWRPGGHADPVIKVGPGGTRKRTGKRRSSGKKGNAKKRNAEVGYILEYGSPRIPAKHWMENAVAASEADVAAAEQEAWDRRLSDLNL